MSAQAQRRSEEGRTVAEGKTNQSYTPSSSRVDDARSETTLHTILSAGCRSVAPSSTHEVLRVPAPALARARTDRTCPQVCLLRRRSTSCWHTTALRTNVPCQDTNVTMHTHLRESNQSRLKKSPAQKHAQLHDVETAARMAALREARGSTARCALLYFLVSSYLC